MLKKILHILLVFILGISLGLFLGYYFGSTKVSSMAKKTETVLKWLAFSRINPEKMNRDIKAKKEYDELTKKIKKMFMNSDPELLTILLMLEK
jgi:hypothetical protein